MDAPRTHRLQLYGKSGCHLCDIARERLWPIAAESGTRIEEVDILADASLFSTYRWRVPVITVDGIEVAEGRLSPRDLNRVAAALRRRRPR